MTAEQMDEVLSGVPDSVREFNEKRCMANGQTVVPAELSAGLSDEERATVKTALLDLIEECRKGGSTIDEPASDRLLAVAHATEVLLALDGSTPKNGPGEAALSAAELARVLRHVTS